MDVLATATRLRAVGCMRQDGGLGSFYADPHGASQRREDATMLCRGGSNDQAPTLAGGTLEKTRAATQSGVQIAVREESA